MAKQKRRRAARVAAQAAGLFKRIQHFSFIKYISRGAMKRLSDIILDSDAQASRKVISR
jgi:hypothetical protein